MIKNGFKAAISKIVWTDKLEPEDFDCRWFSILSRFQLAGHKWLNDLFNLRQQWVPAYFRDWEMSGLMRTSSRSESENHMFQQLMSRSSTLVEFFGFFETAMQGQRFEQSKLTHESLYTSPDIETDYLMEIHASNIFTRAICFEIQRQMKAAAKYCMCFNVDKSKLKETGLKKYIIVDRSIKDSRIDETIDRVENPFFFDEFIPPISEVDFYPDSNDVSCSCRMFERFGYFCRHVFYVLRMCNIVKFQDKYVRRRWCIDALPIKDPQCSTSNHHVGSLEHVGVVVKDIYSIVDHCVNLLMTDAAKLEVFRDTIKDLKEKAVVDMGDIPTVGTKDFIGALVGIPQPDEINVHTPQNIRNKGCGSKRITSSREEAIRGIVEGGKHRTCSFCLEEKHNIRSCPKKKALILAQKFADQEAREQAMAEEIDQNAEDGHQQ